MYIYIYIYIYYPGGGGSSGSGGIGCNVVMRVIQVGGVVAPFKNMCCPGGNQSQESGSFFGESGGWTCAIVGVPWMAGVRFSMLSLG